MIDGEFEQILNANPIPERVSPEELGVQIFEQFRFEDDRGRLGEIWTNESLVSSNPKVLLNTQHVYWTHCRPGVVKAWHYHKNQHDKFHCVLGIFKTVIYNEKKNKYCVVIMSEYDGKTVVIPQELWHGFSNIGTGDAVMVNCSTQPYNAKEPDEYRADWMSFLGAEVWGVQNG